jgi:magnesium transporter
VGADQEEAARFMQHYDLLALPVVDVAHKIVGMITYDDLLDVLEDEATEDIYRLGVFLKKSQPMCLFQQRLKSVCPGWL